MHASIRGVDAKEREGEMVKEKRVIVPLSLPVVTEQSATENLHVKY